MTLMNKGETAQSPRRASAAAVVAINLVLLVLLVCAVEGIALWVNRGTPDGAYPFMVNTQALRSSEGEIRQVGNTAKMSYLDPHLGYAHDHATDDGLGDVGGVPGFAVYGDPDAPDALRIVALGGSTTDPLDPGNWPRALQRLLANQGVPAVVFNGGVSGYSSNQELLKLIRDALPLEPDLVLSLSGINRIASRKGLVLTLFRMLR